MNVIRRTTRYVNGEISEKKVEINFLGLFVIITQIGVLGAFLCFLLYSICLVLP